MCTIRSSALHVKRAEPSWIGQWLARSAARSSNGMAPSETSIGWWRSLPSPAVQNAGKWRLVSQGKAILPGSATFSVK